MWSDQMLSPCVSCQMCNGCTKNGFWVPKEEEKKKVTELGWWQLCQVLTGWMNESWLFPLSRLFCMSIMKFGEWVRAQRRQVQDWAQGAALLGLSPLISVSARQPASSWLHKPSSVSHVSRQSPTNPSEQQKSSSYFQAFFWRCLKFFTVAVTTNPKDQRLAQVFSVFLLRFRSEGFQGLLAAFARNPPRLPRDSQTHGGNFIVPPCSFCNGLQAVFGLAVILPGDHVQVKRAWPVTIARPDLLARFLVFRAACKNREIWLMDKNGFK